LKSFILNGQGAVGKDTFISFIKSMSRDKIANISSVAEIKELAKYYFCWDNDKTSKGRKLLSDLKDLQTEYCDGPFIHMKKEWKFYNTFNSHSFFHIREPKEIQKMVDLTGAKTILITRDTDNKKYGNHADDEVFDYDYDIIINNSGSLEDLQKRAELFIKEEL